MLRSPPLPRQPGFLTQLDRFITFGGASYNAGRIFLLDGGYQDGPYLWDPSRAGAKHGGRRGLSAGGSCRLSGRHRRSDVDQPQCDRRQWHPWRKAAGLICQWHFGYVLRQGVESILVTEAPQNGGGTCSGTRYPAWQAALVSWELIGPGLRLLPRPGCGRLRPVRRLYLRTAKMGTSYGIVMWNVATRSTSNPIEFVPELPWSVRAVQVRRMDFDPRPVGVRAVERRWPDLAPEAAGADRASRPRAGPSYPRRYRCERPAVIGTTGVLGKWKYLRSYGG